jgi:hypothetical protein
MSKLKQPRLPYLDTTTLDMSHGLHGPSCAGVRRLRDRRAPHGGLSDRMRSHRKTVHKRRHKISP